MVVLLTPFDVTLDHRLLVLLSVYRPVLRAHETSGDGGVRSAGVAYRSGADLFVP